MVSICPTMLWLTNVAFFIHGAPLTLLHRFNALTQSSPRNRRCAYRQSVSNTQKLIEPSQKASGFRSITYLLRRISEIEAQRARVDRDRLYPSSRHGCWCHPDKIGLFDLAHALSSRMSSVCNCALTLNISCMQGICWV